ncbi:MAG: ParB N-terminal domain-containing protein [Lachnospiraceae bacterium]|nr:ParB N-terminal domain-containing protein [Lachnospiraceae bacterium]
MSLTPDLEIVYLDPHDLTPYEGNARKHGDVDVQGIKDSIETDGFNDPIGIWGDNNLIVEGHGRQLAAIALGMEKVPCIRLDHLTDAQRRDYAIRHNRTAELSGWDWTTLEREMEDLSTEGFDMKGLFPEQFDPASLDDLFTESPQKEKEAKKIQCPHCGEWFEP